MPFVSPDDKRTTKFRAIIKKEVVVDFSGEEPVIVEESDEYRLTMPFINIHTGYEISSSSELIEAEQCETCGDMVPADDFEHGECSACRAVHERSDLNDMSQAALIRRLLELEKMVGQVEANQPKRRGRPPKAQHSVTNDSENDEVEVKSLEDVTIPSLSPQEYEDEDESQFNMRTEVEIPI